MASNDAYYREKYRDALLATGQKLQAAEAERDRLREALEEIEHYSNEGDWHNKIAREALSRPENERG